jgi:hypothetical protein
MSKPALTIRVYSYYLFLLGAGLIVIPNTVLGLLHFPSTNEIWIRVLGLFTFTVGTYYFSASAQEQTAFFKATVGSRLLFFIMIVIFTVIFEQKPILIGVGSFDLFGALWTRWALRK